MIKDQADERNTNGLKRRKFLEYAGAGVLASAMGAMAVKVAQAQSSSKSKWRKADRSKLMEFPTLSLKERDRRWNIARRIMQDNKVECLFVPTEAGGAGADNFFTNDGPATVIFPLEGEPIALMEARPELAASLLQNEERGEVSWVKDWRFVSGQAAEVEIIKELGLANARIGTLGVTRGAHSYPPGYIQHGLWSELLKELPKVNWVELWADFGPEWLTKSEEELVCFRKAALLAEVAAEEVLEVTKPGVTEDLLHATIMNEIFKYGGGIGGMQLHSGPDNSSWGPPKWVVRGQKPRVIQNGDVINIEWSANYGHISSQAQVCMGVGKVSDINLKIARTAREAYEIGVKLMKPGILFADLARAMSEPNLREGFWHVTPLIHSLNPLDPVSPVTEGLRNHSSRLRERFPHYIERAATGMDFVLREGMTFQIETNSHSGRYRVNIGGNVIVRPNGGEELNEAPVWFRLVP